MKIKTQQCQVCKGTGEVFAPTEAYLWFKDWRERRNKTQREVCEATGIDHGLYSNFENGKRTLTEKDLRKLAKVLAE